MPRLKTLPMLEIFKFKPDFDLAVMTQGQTLNRAVSRIIDGTDGMLNRFRPDIVFAQGDTTERPEGIAAGASRFVGTCPERIVSEASRFLEYPLAHKAMSRIANPYGDGSSARRIVEIMQKEVKG